MNWRTDRSSSEPHRPTLFPTGVVLSRLHFETIRNETLKAGQVECCGLLLGRLIDGQAVVDAVLAAENVADDPAHRFEIDPVMLLSAHRQARQEGRSVIGWYHSHPSGDAIPSACDAECAAEAGKIWIITTADAVGAYCAIDGGDIAGRFRRVAIQVI